MKKIERMRLFRVAQFAAPPLAADCCRIPAAVGEQQTKKQSPSASFHIFLFQKRKMNGISSDNHPFEMPILADGSVA